MAATIKRISAVTLRVSSMPASVRFYRDVLGMNVPFGGEEASFSSLFSTDAESAILNLERGRAIPQWGRLILHVEDVDAVWKHLTELGFKPEQARDASWGERYFHMRDPDGHKLSFARPLE